MRTFERLWAESEDAAKGEERGVMRLTQTELCVLKLSQKELLAS